MDWTWYLFSFKGRINRAKWWLAWPVMIGWTLFTAAIAWIVFLVLTFATRGGQKEHGEIRFKIKIGIDALFALLNPATYHSLSFVDLVTGAVCALGTAILLWMWLATSVKRLQDRERSIWWIMLFVVVPILYDHFEERLPDSYWFLPLTLASLVLSIWAFIEMGFLRGMRGPNRFDPDPLAPASTVDSRPAWDQTSEFEFAPHIGSPPPGMHVKRGHD